MKQSERRADNRRTQINKGLAEIALLCLLRERPHYGLELLERLNAEAGLEVAEGTIYPLLHRLQSAGDLKAQWETNTVNGRPRKYYAITPSGLAELRSMIEGWRETSHKLERLIEGTENE